MTQIVDEAELQLARRITQERRARQWTQADLARHSGVSKAAVSRIERAEISPTASTLVRLASAFDLTLAGLLLRAEGQDLLSREADQPRWQDPGTGYVRQQVFAHPAHPLELVRVILPARQRVTLPAASYEHIRQLVWVHGGTLTVQEGGASHTLLPGDCLGFGAPGDVTFANDTDQSCQYAVLLTRR